MNRILSLFYVLRRRSKDVALEDAIKKAKARRQVAESKIDGMLATLDGCGDQWFLDLKTTIDECNGDNINGAEI